MDDAEQKRAFDNMLKEAWINTRMERDRSLLSLASLGVGLLVTLLSTVGATSFASLFIYGVTFFCFFATIVSAIIVFERNATFIETLLQGEEPNDVWLRRLDRIMFWSFVTGIILSIFLALMFGLESVIDRK